MVQVVSRREWGAAPARTRSAIGRVRGLAVHYVGPAMGWPWGHDACAGKVRGIQAFHMGPQRRWADGAYSFMVCPHGVVYEMRGWGVRTAANGTNEGNAGWHAACYLGGTDTPLTDEAKAALLWLRAESERRYPAGRDHRPHRGLKATACPGDVLVRWMAAGWPAGGTPAPPPQPQPQPPPQPPADGRPTKEQIMALPVLREGARGQHVANMQGLLVAHGNRLAVDGIFGPGTAATLRDWQRRTGSLAPDAVCGPATWVWLTGVS